MALKDFPLTKEELERVVREYPTPFHLYSEQGIRESAGALNDAFSCFPGGYRNFFAVKANAHPSILEITASEGHGADCSSIPEIHISQAVGLSGGDMIFTSNNTSQEAFREAAKAGAIINLDDITFIDKLKKAIGGLPKALFFRYNPGDTDDAELTMGTADAKYGLTRRQIFDAFRTAREMGVEKIGLHAMIVSNELNPAKHIKTAKTMFELAAELKPDWINLGGGIGTQYRPDQVPLDLDEVAKADLDLYKKILWPNRLQPEIFTESGRFVTGPNGWLVTRARHVMKKHKDFIGVDAPTAALFRSAIYASAYHHAVILGKEHLPHDHKYHIGSGLCEDVKFGKDRMLPKAEEGDVIIFYNTGAHGIVMGNNYNGELRPAELLLRPDGSIEQVTTPETERHLFSRMNHPGLARFK
jgi:diaminopimelate decarboxylase